MIKAILWDIDGTVLDFIASQAKSMRARFDEFNIGKCTDEMLERYTQINNHYWEMLERQEITKQGVLISRFCTFFEEIGVDAPVEEFNEAYEMGLPDFMEYMPCTMEVIRSLKGKVKQYAVTNGAFAVQKKRLERSGLNELLDGAFISDAVGFEKPSVDFFNYVFDNIEPFKKDEIMIVGDSLTSDMLGGNNAGIICCWFNPNHQENTKGVKIDFEIDDINKVLELI